MKKISINGPVNYVKLEGNNNKILHVFFDIHYNLNEQTECSDYDSINFDKYINNLLLTTKKDINFFLEIRPDDKHDIHIKNDIYIGKVVNNFDYLKENVKSNVKLYYINIRYFFYLNDILNGINYFTINFFNDIQESNNVKKQIEKISDGLDILSVTSETLYTILNIYQILLKKNIPFDKVNLSDNKFVDNKKNKSEDNNKLQYNSIIQILTKLMKKYKEKNSGVIMNKLIKEYFIDGIISIINKLSEVTDVINTYITILKNGNDNIKICKYFDNIYSSRSNICLNDFVDFKHDVNKKINEIVQAIEIIFSQLQDLYFIRKFIDKDYIKESIIYTGSDHSIVCIYILVKYFNFKITDYYYFNKHLLKNDSIDEINSSISNANHHGHLYPYFYSSAQEKQCIKINPI
jgi:hypothetical protein